MIRPDRLILGYVTFRVEKEYVAKAAERLMRGGISAKISRAGSFSVSASVAPTVERMLADIPHTSSSVRGLYGFLLRVRRRFGFLFALAIVSALIAVSSQIVWDIRIEGCETGDEEQIADELSAAGLSVGSLWWRVDKSRVETEALISSDTISWININRRGGVAYVSVIPKVVYDSEEPKRGYANLVASRDCVIEEITVKEGVALVRVGESVRAGQVLISGVIPAELGGGYCYADGTVKGRYTDTVSVKVEKFVDEKVYTDEKCGEVTLDFFGLSVNIFKRYGNSDMPCDIIEEKREFRLGEAKLPWGLNVTTIRSYEPVRRTLTAEEMTAMATEALREALLSALSAADLLKIKTDGAFDGEAYAMWADVVVRADVASVKEFEFHTE